MSLKGKRALVTGGSRGIGWAIVRALLREGARVFLCARGSEGVKEAVTALAGEFPGRVEGVTADVREPEQVRDFVASGSAHLGGLDILINNAGVGLFKEVEKMSPREWRDLLSTNLDGVFYACHYAIPEMRKGSGGFIVNVASLAGRNAFPGGGAYNASKFGLVGFSEALMQEVRQQGIRVAYVMPGSVNTWFNNRPPRPEDSWKLAPEDVAEAVLYILKSPERALSSRIEIRPSRPPRKH